MCVIVCVGACLCVSACMCVRVWGARGLCVMVGEVVCVCICLYGCAGYGSVYIGCV